jgi:hypothetical protein
VPNDPSDSPSDDNDEEWGMSATTGYKVSCVVEDGSHSGAIVSMDQRPEVGEEVRFDGAVFQIVELEELIAPMGDFGFLHATCRYVRDLR